MGDGGHRWTDGRRRLLPTHPRAIPISSPQISAAHNEKTVTATAPPAPSSVPSNTASIVAQLMAVIEDRKRNPPAKSYTTTLLNGGIPKIGGKVQEEAREVVEAAYEAGEQGRKHVIAEASDVIYHLLVLLAHQDVKWDEVEAEIARRFGISGLDEKALRKA
jgi:phosphoribosyl-ATP pyrophosphohydrolase